MKGKILVVEDDKFTGRMMELQFHKHDYDITVTPGGEEALKILEEETFDLVLSDVTMPGISGLELLRQIRTRHDRIQLPVILITAMEQSPQMGEALRLGVNDFFTKPKEFGITLNRVQLQVEWRRALLGHQEKGNEDNASGMMLRGPIDGLWSWSIARDKVQYSQRWKAILGFGPKELDATISQWYDRIHPEDLDRVKQGIQNHLSRTNPLFQDDFRMLNKQGAWIWVHAFGVALFDKSGVAARMVGSLCSIVGKKEVEQKAAALSKELAGARRDLEWFCDNVSLTPEERSRLSKVAEKIEDILGQYGNLV